MNANFLIMLADDDEDDCCLFKEALKETSHSAKLIIVRHGEEVMEWLSQPSKTVLPDVLFLDLNMPRKNGFECLVEIKNHPELQSLPVIILSTSFEPRIVKQLYSNGAFMYICKPNDFSQLKAVIEQALTAASKKTLTQLSLEQFVLTEI